MFNWLKKVKNWWIDFWAVITLIVAVGLWLAFSFVPKTTGGALLALVVMPLAGYYIIYGLARANILWGIVEQGWCRIVLTWGKYARTIRPGLRWVGIPGINTLYKRKMTFLKSITDKDGKPQAEPHEDEDVSSFKTTDYAYAFPFKDEEDSHGLPLSGILAVIAVLEDYHKAFFVASDWYASMNSEIMPCFRRVLAEVSYDDDIVGRDTELEQKNETLSDRLREKLDHKPNGQSSILDRLFDLYGIKVKSVQLRSVDPPPDWRGTTLAPYKAQREKEAAKHQAEASAILFDDTNQALKVWLEGQRAAGYSPTQAQIDAKQEELRQRALAKTPGYQQIHIKGLEGATTAVVGGGGAGILVGGQGKPGKNPGGNPGGQGGQGQQGDKRRGQTTQQEEEDELRRHEEEDDES